jgi:XapX domain-containing protein
MKAMLISFVVGLMVGAVYAFLRVRSPAPPLVALAGLLGMVWGEQLIQSYVAKKSSVAGGVTSSRLQGSDETTKVR